MTDTLERPTISEADEQALLDSIDRWLTRKVAPVASKYEEADEYPTELVHDMCEMGLFGALIEPQWGGLGLPAITYSRIVARISEEWMSLTGFFNSHLMMALIVQKFGTPAQKDHWLPRFATGELRGGLALTEPDAGTDLQGIRTTARKDGDVYRINGSKLWITNAIEGDILAVLVKTDPGAEPRHRGMSMLIVPTRDPETGQEAEGVVRGRKLPKLGYRGIDTGAIAFDDAPVDARLGLVGGEEGQGLPDGDRRSGDRPRQRRRARGRHRPARAEGGARLRPGAHHHGQADRPEAPGDPAEARRDGRQDPRVRADGRGRCACSTTGAAASIWRPAWPSGSATETAFEVATEVDAHPRSLRLLQGKFPIERLYRDAPLLMIGEGTNEMQRIIIARQLIARNPVWRREQA